MDIKIYQINTERDEKNAKFLNLELLKKFTNTEDIDASIYDEVFSGNIDCKDLEDIFDKFNSEGHPLHRGHKLSVSDIVVVEGDAPKLVGKIRFYEQAGLCEECEFTDQLKFETEIREALDVGRTIEVDNLKGKSIPTVENGAYFCDSVGFKKVDFDVEKTQKPKNLMRVVYVEPGRKPFVSEIVHSLDAEQKAVGGLIEPII